MRADGTRTRARSRTCPALSLPGSPVLVAVARPGAGTCTQHVAVAMADGHRTRAGTHRLRSQPARPPYSRHQHPVVPAGPDRTGARRPRQGPLRGTRLRAARDWDGLVGDPTAPDSTG